eukprot:364620-Chlamydomonas_euryale.AAC.6
MAGLHHTYGPLGLHGELRPLAAILTCPPALHPRMRAACVHTWYVLSASVNRRCHSLCGSTGTPDRIHLLKSNPWDARNDSDPASERKRRLWKRDSRTCGEGIQVWRCGK